MSQNEATFSLENPYYRAMTPDTDGLPVIGRNARTLGVRIPGDISPDENGIVKPETGGMSVAPGSIWNVPNHRRPRGMQKGSTGPSGDFMYEIKESAIPVTRLVIRCDPAQPELHGFVEPATPVELSTYESDLASTRVDWRRIWP